MYRDQTNRIKVANRTSARLLHCAHDHPKQQWHVACFSGLLVAMQLNKAVIVPSQQNVRLWKMKTIPAAGRLCVAWVGVRIKVGVRVRVRVRVNYY